MNRQTVCRRDACSEILAKPTKQGICGFCIEELLRAAIRDLVSSSLRARAEAVFYLREHGYSSGAVKSARREVRAGADVELIVKRLDGACVEAAA